MATVKRRGYPYEKRAVETAGKAILKTAIRKRLDAPPETLDAYLSGFRGEKLLLYGAGGTGRFMLALLQSHGLEAVAFLDRKASSKKYSVSNVPVYPPRYSGFSAMDKKNALIILSLVAAPGERENLRSFLRRLGYVRIIDALTIIAKAIPFDGTHHEPGRAILIKETKNILSVLENVGDAHSRDVYISGITAHLSRNYHAAVESVNTEQYFSPGTPRGKGFGRFIDCGAYIGDTLQKIALSPVLEAYAGFEPGRDSFIKLSETAKTLPATTLSCLFPCAVGNATRTAAFNDEPGFGAIDATGAHFVQVVRLDDVLRGFRPTMIKMDIEGGEFDALRGAKDLITRYRPDLAICIYHRISDYWRIPRLIHSWKLGYRFYLRAHGSATIETVLYAIAPEPRTRSIRAVTCL